MRPYFQMSKYIFLKEVADIIMGQSPASSTYNDEGKGLPFYQGKAEFGVRHPIVKKWCSAPLKIADQGDILLSVRAPVGPTNICNVKSCIGRGLAAIRCKKNKADHLFIWFYRRSIEKRIASKGVGSTFTAIGREEISKIQVPSVNYSTQRKIASILSAYDDLIENNLRRIKILEEMAQMIYREWFVNFRFPEHEKVKMVKSELGMIPEGWEVKKLGDVCNVVMGQSPKSEYYNTEGNGLPFHQGVKDFGSRFPTHNTYCTLESRIAEQGDILISVRAPVGRINLASEKLIIGRGLSAIRHKHGLQSFLLYQLKHIFREEDSMGSGTIYRAITKDDLLNLNIIHPSSNIDKEFNELLNPMDAEIENLTLRTDILRKTRNLLLPKLISGEIKIGEINLQATGSNND